MGGGCRENHGSERLGVWREEGLQDEYVRALLHGLDEGGRLLKEEERDGPEVILPEAVQEGGSCASCVEEGREGKTGEGRRALGEGGRGPDGPGRESGTRGGNEGTSAIKGSVAAG